MHPIRDRVRRRLNGNLSKRSPKCQGPRAHQLKFRTPGLGTPYLPRPHTPPTRPGPYPHRPQRSPATHSHPAYSLAECQRQWAQSCLFGTRFAPVLLKA